MQQQAELSLIAEQSQLSFHTAKRNMSILKSSKNAQKSIWDIKNIFFPKNKTSLPIAKMSPSGQLISNQNELQKLYLEHFCFRMRNRPILPGMEDYQDRVEKQFQNILKSTKTLSIPDWTMHDLDKVLKSLKISQSPDRMELVNELFSPRNVGSDLKLSLLRLFNIIKNTIIVEF